MFSSLNFAEECILFAWAKKILNLHIKTKHDTAGVEVTVFSMPGLFTVKTISPRNQKC